METIMVSMESYVKISAKTKNAAISHSLTLVLGERRLSDQR